MLVLRGDFCFLGVLTLPGLAACGVGGCGTNPKPVTSFALPLRGPGAANRFGRQEVIPAVSSIILTDLNDPSLASPNGAVRLFTSLIHALIANIFSDEAGLPGLIPQYTGLSQG